MNGGGRLCSSASAQPHLFSPPTWSSFLCNHALPLTRDPPVQLTSRLSPLPQDGNLDGTGSDVPDVARPGGLKSPFSGVNIGGKVQADPSPLDISSLAGIASLGKARRPFVARSAPLLRVKLHDLTRAASTCFAAPQLATGTRCPPKRRHALLVWTWSFLPTH